MKLSKYQGPLLSPTKVALIWITSFAILYQVMAAACRGDALLHKLIPTAFAAGHVCLVLLVARGRLLDKAPIGKRWTDVVTVLGAQWVGPLWWYYEWRRFQRLSLDEPNIRRGSTQKILFFLLAALAALLIVWRLYLAGLL